MSPAPKTPEPAMSEAERLYHEYGGCNCAVVRAPCSFCIALTEEEANVLWADGMNALRDMWRALDVEAP